MLEGIVYKRGHVRACFLFLLFIASQAHAGFFGNTISANYEWPNLGTILYASGNAIAGTNVEFPNVGGEFVIVDFSDTGFRIIYPVGWFLNTVTPKTFDGFVMLDVLDTIADIAGVSLAGTNISGYNSSQLSFDMNHVYVNQLGFSGFSPGSFIDVNVSFGDTLATQAAALAEQVEGGGYKRGAKGWSWRKNNAGTSIDPRFVAPEEIKTSGYFWNHADPNVEANPTNFDSVLDCSGLVFWSYNKASGATRYQTESSGLLCRNPVCYESADGQYWNNSEPVNESNLKAGDMLFFDFTEPFGDIDHMAMYVGRRGPGGADVVEASFDMLRGINGKWVST